MTTKLRNTMLLTALLALFGCGQADTHKALSEESAAPLTQEAVEDAYIWGLSIVSMYRYTESLGNRVDGINQMFHFRDLFEPGLISGGPNRDTLYSTGWFDVSEEPVVVSLPDFEDRYFVVQLTDLYSHNFKNIGSHLLNTDTRRYKTGHEFMLAGPDWQGEAPDGVELVRAPVNVFHFLLRIAVKDDPWDIARGRKLQEGTATMPLSARLAGGEQTTRHSNQLPGTAYRPVLAFGQGYDGTYQRDPEFFAVLEDALEINTPYTDIDKSMVEGTLAAMGVGSEQGFDLSSFDAATRALILDAQESGFNKVIGLKHQGWGPKINGWQYGPPNHGDYGRDFIRRAYGTYMGGMWPKPENSTYAMAYVDGKGTTLTGTNRYSLKFSAEQIPPATSFWSVTVYDAGSFDLHPNAEELYVVGSNHPSTKFAADGSMEVVFSQARPEDLGNANWIPVPDGEFLLCIRFYAPTSEVLDLSYRIPPVNLEDHVGSELAQVADWHAIPGGNLDP